MDLFVEHLALRAWSLIKSSIPCRVVAGRGGTWVLPLNLEWKFVTTLGHGELRKLMVVT